MHPANKPLQYKIAISSISQHVFDVELEIDNRQYDTLNLSLPTWIPGSYMVRDFAKNILQICALNEKGNTLAIEQKDKQSWQVSTEGEKTIIVYKVYAFDLSIRAAFLDSEFGFANGTSVFLQVDEFKDQPSDVYMVEEGSPASWHLYTAMPGKQIDERGYGHYETSSYADLIEHPLLYAQADTISFEVQGIEFKMVLAGGHNADLERIKTDLEKICQHHLKLFGNDLGIKQYVFQTLLSESDFGGLEHTHSTALLFSRNDLPGLAQRDTMTDGYRSFLGLCSHELFHTWHVKRIKPKTYLTPDLSKECYSEQLWIYEGFTSYYDDFSLLRSGIISKESYLELLGQTLTRLQRTQGRKVQTVTQSSFEAWTKFYKQDENAINGIVSYYIKGAVIALCLDLLIKQSSKHIYSLDSVMRFLWKHYGKELSGTDDNVIQQVLSDGLGLDLSQFLHSALYTTDELPWQALLDEFGVTTHFRARTGIKDIGGKPSQTSDNCIDLGMAYSSEPAGILVQQVTNNRAAEKAGLQKGDRLVALNGWELKGKSLETELAKFELGQKVPLTLFRRGKLKQLDFTVYPAEKDTIYLTIENEELAQHWLG
ncbi:M61 family metallopeptidase [Planctobacterium marinum]|uniref:Peptidase M61 n=1 Tax=Planctobacterium marinum TaxID=1631968 RepID=A0AA48HNK7_9ALTE|nr:peptidase M61 [Planctobacterium marinum]